MDIFLHVGGHPFRQNPIAQDGAMERCEAWGLARGRPLSSQNARETPTATKLRWYAWIGRVESLRSKLTAT